MPVGLLVACVTASGITADMQGHEPRCTVIAEPLKAAGEVAPDDAWLGEGLHWWLALASVCVADVRVWGAEKAERYAWTAEECPSCAEHSAHLAPRFRIGGTFRVRGDVIVLELALVEEGTAKAAAERLRIEGSLEEPADLFARASREVMRAIGVSWAPPQEALRWDTHTFRAFIEAMRHVPAWPYHGIPGVGERGAQEASAAHEVVLADHPSFWPSRLALACLAAAAGYHRTALEVIAEGRADWPSGLRPQSKVASYLGDLVAPRARDAVGNYRAWLEACVGAESSEPDTYAMLAPHVWFEDPDRAVRLYEKAIALSRDPGDLYVGLAQAHLLARGPGAALKALDQYEKSGGAYTATAHAIAGEAYAALGDAEQAVQEFRASVALQPELWTMHFAFARSANQLGLYDIEAEQRREMIRLGRDGLHDWSRLAAACLRAGDTEGAGEAFDRMEEIAPDKARVARWTVLSKFYEENLSADPNLRKEVTLDTGRTTVAEALTRLSEAVGHKMFAVRSLREEEIEFGAHGSPAWEVMDAIAVEIPAEWDVRYTPDGERLYVLQWLQP